MRRDYTPRRMLSPDVRVEGFSAEEWMRLGHVLRSQSRAEAPQSSPGPVGGVVAVTTSGRLRKLVSTRHGRIDLVSHPWPLELAELAARHEARWAIELTTGSLERLADTFADRLRPSDTYLSQVLEFLLVLRELEASRDLTMLSLIHI